MLPIPFAARNTAMPLQASVTAIEILEGRSLRCALTTKQAWEFRTQMLDRKAPLMMEDSR